MHIRDKRILRSISSGFCMVSRTRHQLDAADQPTQSTHLGIGNPVARSLSTRADITRSQPVRRPRGYLTTIWS